MESTPLYEKRRVHPAPEAWTEDSFVKPPPIHTNPPLRRSRTQPVSGSRGFAAGYGRTVRDNADFGDEADTASWDPGAFRGFAAGLGRHTFGSSGKSGEEARGDQ